MKENILKKLKSLLLNRRREMLEQVAQLEFEREELELKVLPATRLCRNCAQKYEEAQKLRKHHRDEIIDDELLDEYRNLNDESSSIGRLKLPDDENLLNIEEV